ncbi:BTAD domain-containing putative transcriptional regulator [Nitratireductor sp. XY-223]|uniref:BTAD domain-containing putative transcriptional regulator n=1 Tax=Nitratireductor sp. XY-223 TaxID=2561926 RepID=UPI0010AA26DA|nr:BTAD domain-containing putative transcriptional regulator [Nitratireductor sp. XY-223]
MLTAGHVGAVETRLKMAVTGGFSLLDAEGRPVRIPNKKACAILAYLAFSDSGTETRERLAGLLWSRKSEEQARASLRQCLKQLRNVLTALDFDGFYTDRQNVGLDKSGLTIDVVAFVDELKRAAVPETLLFSGATPDRILYGFESLDHAFTNWLQVIRRSWHDLMVDCAQALLKEDRADTAIAAAKALVNIDPSHEEARRFLIRSFAGEGNMAAALRCYNELWELLAEEYDMEPDEETQALIADVKSGAFGAATPRTGGAGTGSDYNSMVAMPSPKQPATMPTIGVSAFASSGPRGDSYLIDGFRHELVASLVRFREWSILDLSNRDEDATQFGGGPKYLIEGVFAEYDVGSRKNMSIILTLKDKLRNSYIWSEEIKSPIDEAINKRRKLIRKIATSINLFISADRLANVVHGEDLNFDVYDLYLQGQALIHKWRPESHQAARHIIQQVVDRAPTFVPALHSMVSLENTHHLVYCGSMRSPERTARALQHATRAVELDPYDSRAQLSLAWCNAMSGKFNQAVLNYDLAIQLNENEPWTMNSVALGLAYCGEFDKARLYADRALQADSNPIMPAWGYQAGVRFMLGDYQGCVAATERAGDALPYLPAWKAAAHALLGEDAAARNELDSWQNMLAQNWYSKKPFSPAAAFQWIMQAFPIREAQTQKHLQDGLRLAGTDG